MKQNRRIYLDHAATTSLDPQIFEDMLPYLTTYFGNASSLHDEGQKAFWGIDEARRNIAVVLQVDHDEIFFTSGATESNNWALFGIIEDWKKNHPGKNPEIITSFIEHPSILEPIRFLEKKGIIPIFCPVDSVGKIDIEFLRENIHENTALVSVMFANNEIGTLEPIAEIGKIIKEVNSKREKKEQVFFHTDAVQAWNYCFISPKELNIDLLSLSGHKLYGPKGIGMLYIRNGIQIAPIFFGGGQQKELRPGTFPTFLIVGLGSAVKRAHENRNPRRAHVEDLAKYFRKNLEAIFPEVQWNGLEKDRLPNNIHFSFPWGSGEKTLIALDLMGVAIGTGSACSTGSLESSHVLRAIGIKNPYLENSLRVTLGKDTTKEEIDLALLAFSKIFLKQERPKKLF